MVGRKDIAPCAVLLTSLLSGCAPPEFDVPIDRFGQPTVATIVRRIECEISQMVRDDKGPSDVTSSHRRFLLNGDYDVAVSLSLDVTEGGGLAPSLSYIEPLSKVASFMFSGNATLSEARDHNFTENIQISVRKIYTDWKSKVNLHECPAEPGTNLAGTLNILDFVAMADSTPDLDENETAPKQVFGGYIQFTVTKNVNAVGPTWSLEHFKGPGGLASMSKVNLDKVTLAFAEGPNVGKRIEVPHTLNPAANALLQQLITSSINSQLNAITNVVP
jgi:hypothetical protein